MLFNHDSGLIQSVITIDTTVAPTLGGSNTLQIVGTGALILPVGSQAQRPASPVTGMQRFNTSLSKVEYYNGSAWVEGSDGTVTSVTITSSDIGGLTVNGTGTATITNAGSIEIALDPTLVNLAKSLPSASGGPVVRLSDDTFISRVFLATAPVGITNGDGVNGDPTISVNAELTGLSLAATNGLVTRTATGTYAQRTITGTTDATTGSIVVTDGAGATSNPTISFTPGTGLTSVLAVGNGIVAKTADNTYTPRTIVGTGSIVVTNGDGIGGNPTISYTAGANLAGLEALNGTGYIVQTGPATFANRTISGSTDTTTGSIVVTDGAAGTGTSISFTPGVELGGVAALSTSGLVARTAAGVYTGRTIQGSTSDAGTITVDFADGISGNPKVNFAASAELAALSTISATGLLSRDSAGVYTGNTIVGQGSIVVTYGKGLEAGNINISYTAGANLGALDSMSTTGIMVRTGTNTYTTLAVAGTAGQIDVANGDGVAGAPTVALAAVTQASSGTFSKVTLDGFGRVTGNTAVTAADVTALVGSTYVNATGDTMAGNLNMGGNTVTNLAVPTGGTDAVTKNYVDAMATGLSWKAPAVVATTADITLTGEQTIDGVAVVTGDRVLVRAQAAAVDNGIWIVSSGYWSRAVDLDAPQESRAATLFIEQGTSHANTAWTQTSEVVAVGTTPMVFVQFAGAGAYTAGTGLSLVGNAFSITTPVSTSLGGTGLTTTGTTGQILGVGASGLEYKTVSAADGSGVSVTNSAGSIALANTGVLSNAAGAGISIDVATGHTTITNTGVLSVTTSGAGVSANTAAGVTTIANTGVTSAIGGTGVAVDVSTGAVTFSNTGVLSLATAGTGLSVDQAAGVVTITGSGITTINAGLGLASTTTAGVTAISNTGVVSISSATPSLTATFDSVTGTATLTNNGVTSVAATGTGITTSTAAGVVTITNTGVLSNTAGDGISISGATGASTITNTGVLALTAGTGVTIAGTQANQTITNNGVVGLQGTTNQVTVSGTAGGTFTVGLPASVTVDTALTVTGLGADKVLTTGAAGVVQGVSLLNGQVLIGSSTGAPVAANITAGTGVTVTNSPNGISISVAGGVAVNTVTGKVGTGSTTALQVSNTGPSSDPIITYTVDAGLESLAALSGFGLVVQQSDNSFAARTLIAGTGVEILNASGAGGDITISNTGVTSVGLALPGIFDVSNSPVTTTGTLTAALVSQPQATVFAAPATGSGVPTFRALVPSDLGLNLYRENSVTAVAPSATGDNSIALGSASVAALTGQIAHASGQFATAGDAQSVEMVLRGATSDGTANELFLNGTSLQALLPANSAWNFTVQIVGRRVGGGSAAAYRFDGIIVKDTLASSTAFVGIPSKVILGETSAPWDAAVVADVASGALKITATGEAATDVKWVATIRATQVIC